MALNLGTVTAKLAVDITVDGCEHTTLDDREAIVGYLRKETDARLVLTVRVLDHTPAPDAGDEAHRLGLDKDQLRAFLEGGVPVEDEFRRRVVSRPTYTSVDPDEQVVDLDPGTVRVSARQADHILARLRGVQLTPEDGERIIEAVRARVR
jgi:hypothetical protein